MQLELDDDPWVRRESFKRSSKYGVSSEGTKNKCKNKLKRSQQRLQRAIYVDQVSRIIFPTLFVTLNIFYWLIFYEHL